MTAKKVGRPAKSRPEEGLKKRVPVHQSRDRLGVKNLCPKDHVDRWVTDGMKNDPHRVQRFLDAGWRLVCKDGSTVGERTVNSAEGTASFVTQKDVSGTLYYMVIHKDFYNEDQKEKQKMVDQTEEAIIASTQAEGRYGSIKIE